LHVPVASRRQAGWLGTREADSGSPNTSDDALCSSVAICPVLDPLSSDETWPRSRGPSDLQLFGCICLNHRAMLSYPSPTRAGFLLLVTEPWILPHDMQVLLSLAMKRAPGSLSDRGTRRVVARVRHCLLLSTIKPLFTGQCFHMP
jgi:hypothetical protein